MQDFEKLGAFYLGAVYDLAGRRRTDSLLLYDSRDLVTHAVCVGMTGSGKTGLCIGLVEEAAIDGIPAILIDPKGDLSNLLLALPELRPEDFRPWINPDDARLKGVTDEQYAAGQADAWRRGLAEWGQDGSRIRRLRERAEFAVYTPRSSAGLPVSIVSSFAAPADEDREALRERVTMTATSILGLLGMDADPLRSREHILLSTVLDCAWRRGRSLELGAIIQDIQNPPVTKIGALDLESFFPARDRFQFAAALNNLLAAPGFEAWMEGEPLDIARLLHTAEGKPRISIFSIAHLDDNERMFFVSLLLNQVLSWMRAQPGTSSLRAIVYMDEIFGYFPPVANPPSKAPLLTLLKQARAFGVGVVLATQNPVDLDYKGLANAGTWFIGRLQTERDKARLLDGLEGAAAGAGKGFDRAALDRMLSALGNRVFLLNDVHEDQPVVFETRWTLSYLRGPLTRAQVKSLMDPLRQPAAAAAAPPAAGSSRPMLPPEVPQYFLPGPGATWRPVLLGAAQVNFPGLTREVVRIAGFGGVTVDWDESQAIDVSVDSLLAEPPADARFADVPAAAANPRSYAKWSREFAAWVAQNERLELFRSPGFKLTSRPGESERDFRVRVQQAARERRDETVESLRRKYAPKLAALQERLRRAQAAEERERQQAQDQKLGAAISLGTTVLGALFGRKMLSSTTLGRAGSTMRSASRARKEAEDVARAAETVAAVQQQLEALQAEFDAETAAVQIDDAVERTEVRPKRADVAVRLVALAWQPV